MTPEKFISDWHELVESRDMAKLDLMLADDAVMISPVVHTPQKGKQITKMYLTAALHVLANDSFKYVRDFKGDNAVVLEFETELNGIHLNGIDMITYNDEGKISEFRVMVRPLKAVNMIHSMMGEMLKSLSR